MSTAVQDIAPRQPQEADSERTERVFKTQGARALVLRRSSAVDRIEKIKRLRQAMFDRTQQIYAACHADFAKPAPEVDITEILPVVM